MKDIFEILKNNWQPIVAVLVLILSFILQLIKKKPVENIYGAIFTFCIDAVNVVESCNFNNHKGIDKLHDAVQLVYKSLKHNFPNIVPETYYGSIVEFIEMILSTPQKKGGSTDGR